MLYLENVITAFETKRLMRGIAKELNLGDKEIFKDHNYYFLMANLLFKKPCLRVRLLRSYQLIKGLIYGK